MHNMHLCSIYLVLKQIIHLHVGFNIEYVHMYVVHIVYNTMLVK